MTVHPLLKDFPNDPDARQKWFDEKFQLMKFKPKIDVQGLPENATLRRFLDIPKLFDLLGNQRLILPRLRSLVDADPFECNARKSYDDFNRSQLEAYALDRELYVPPCRSVFFKSNALSDILSSNPKPPFERYLQNMTDEELRNIAWFLERERLKNSVACSCWYHHDNESDAMWRIYSDKIGAAITSSVSRLKEGILHCSLPKISTTDFRLTLAKVDYKDVNISGDMVPWLIKRSAFEHEHEVRLFADIPFGALPHFELVIDMSALIEEIVISPFAKEWEAKAIESALNLFSDKLAKVKVRQSNHMSIPDNDWPSPQLTP